jgi:hypothetical protein
MSFFCCTDSFSTASASSRVRRSSGTCGLEASILWWSFDANHGSPCDKQTRNTQYAVRSAQCAKQASAKGHGTRAKVCAGGDLCRELGEHQEQAGAHFIIRKQSTFVAVGQEKPVPQRAMSGWVVDAGQSGAERGGAERVTRYQYESVSPNVSYRMRRMNKPSSSICSTDALN